MVSIEVFKTLCMNFPKVEEMPHFHKTSFRIKKKIFATLDEKTQKATLKLNLKDQDLFGLIDQTMIYPVPNKWGKQGWTIVELNKINESLLKDILTNAYIGVKSK
ncbi:MmcQ/YjbR family DNA-binding protein [Algoriphagus aestuarii]|nr:MmcQ/YjbR family DNA-binding protein [Algoriphagus aestuarii]